MKKTIKTIGLYLAAFIILLQTGYSQDQTLLYKIEGNGMTPSYLYGTIHVLPAKDFVMKEKVKKAFGESDIIALEIDMDDPGLQMEMMKYATMKDDVSIDQLLDEKEYKLLDDELKGLIGMGVEPMKKMKPFFISSMLITKLVGEQPASFENTFVQMSKEAEKEIVGLEEIADQMSIFDEIPYQKQADELMEMLNQEDEMKDLFGKMLDEYLEEDVDGLYELFVTYYAENDPESQEENIDLLLNNRNNNWIPKIEELTKDQSVFIGVGAGHLGGEQGVLNLLKKAGYTVEGIMD